MEIKEIIRKVYQKSGVQVDDNYIEDKIKDEEKVKQFMRIYKQEEIKSMNYIFGKPTDNKVFTKKELEMIGKIDLFDRTVIKWSKLIWDNRNNEENLEEIQKALKERRCPKCM